VWLAQPAYPRMAAARGATHGSLRALAAAVAITAAAVISGLELLRGPHVFLRPAEASCAGRARHRPATWAASPLGGRRIAVARPAAGVIERPPPPPAELDEGDGEEEYEVRFLTNEEREYFANLWLPLSTEEDRELLEKAVLPFRSTKMFTGKSRLCVGAFVGNQCEGMATTEVVPDFSDFSAFFIQKRCLRCLAIVTRPRVRTEAGSLIVKAVKQLADESGYRADFEPIQDVAGGKYWILARSL